MSEKVEVNVVSMQYVLFDCIWNITSVYIPFNVCVSVFVSMCVCFGVLVKKEHKRVREFDYIDSSVLAMVQLNLIFIYKWINISFRKWMRVHHTFICLSIQVSFYYHQFLSEQIWFSIKIVSTRFYLHLSVHGETFIWNK